LTEIIFGWLATALCIVGNCGVIRKWQDGFLIWFCGTGILLVLAMMSHNYSQAVLFAVYEVINLWGYVKWRGEDN
jgi:nicotinamide riboside transporter PnuC